MLSPRLNYAMMGRVRRKDDCHDAGMDRKLRVPFSILSESKKDFSVKTEMSLRERERESE